MAGYKKIIILEGFDMVGKSTYANEFLKVRTYYPNHDITDVTIGRNNSWAIGYSVLDFLSQIDVRDEHIVINRGVFSSYVYSKLYGHSEDELPEAVIDYYRNSQFFKDNVSVIYFQHFSRSSAKVIYESSMSRQKSFNELTAKLDQFSDFDQYWRAYSKASELFIESFNLIGVTPYYFRTGDGYFLETSPLGETKYVYDESKCDGCYDCPLEGKCGE